MGEKVFRTQGATDEKVGVSERESETGRARVPHRLKKPEADRGEQELGW